MKMRSIAAVVPVLLALLAPTPARAGKSLSAELFEVQLAPGSGGDVLVTETVVFRFRGGPFTRAFRHLPRRHTDGIDILEARLGETVLPRGRAPGQFEVQDGDPVKVTWHFPAVSDTTRAFVLHYRLRGAIASGTEDLLVLDVVPAEHDYEIDHVIVSVMAGEGGRRPLELSLDCDAPVLPAQDGLSLSASDVDDDEEVTLTARFPGGSFAAWPPAWQARERERAAAARPLAGPGLIALLVTTLGGGVMLAGRYRSDQRPVPPAVAGPLREPPAELPPALAGRLLGLPGNDLGALVELARRGAVRFRREPGDGKSAGIIVEPGEAGAARAPHERALLALVFGPERAPVGLTEAGKRLLHGTASFQKDLDAELVARGWLDPERCASQRRQSVAGLLAMLGGLVLGGLGGVMAGTSLIRQPDFALAGIVIAGIGAGGFALSLAHIVHAAGYSRLTPAGEGQKRSWQAFRAHLQQMTRKDATADPVDLERFAPLAVAMGLGQAWARHLAVPGGAPLPAWLQATDGVDLDLASLLTALIAADASGHVGAGGDGGSGGGGASGAD